MELADNPACCCSNFATRNPGECCPRLNGYPMTQPVLYKQSFMIALLAAIQAVVPAAVAVASLYLTIVFFGVVFDRSSQAIIIVAVLCLILVQPPREVKTQLTTARISAVAEVLFRWLLLLAVMLAIGYVTKSLAEYPRRIFLTWAAVTPFALVGATMLMQEVTHHFLMNAFENR